MWFLGSRAGYRKKCESSARAGDQVYQYWREQWQTYVAVCDVTQLCELSLNSHTDGSVAIQFLQLLFNSR
jgi:hypothetical protein